MTVMQCNSDGGISCKISVNALNSVYVKLEVWMKNQGLFKICIAGSWEFVFGIQTGRTELDGDVELRSPF